MNRFWMLGGAVIVVAMAAMMVNPGQMRSSENLLSKAQSEFEVKAKDALIQRFMAQVPATTAAPAATKPSVVASLETVVFPQDIARVPSRKAPRTLTAQDLESLRARSPEFADAMARYM